MARTRKRSADTTEPAEVTEPHRARSRKVSERKADRSRSPVVVEDPKATDGQDIARQLVFLDEMTRQAKVLMQDLRETQQRYEVMSAQRASAVEDQLAGCRQEMAEIRQHMQALPEELRDLLDADRQLGKSTSRGAIAESSPAGEIPRQVPPVATAPVRGWLGVTVEPAVIVAEVLPGTPAETAGLVPGDVIIGVNGVRVLDAAELQALVNQEAGEEITLQLARGEEKRAVRVLLDIPAAEVGPLEEVG